MRPAPAGRGSPFLNLVLGLAYLCPWRSQFTSFAFTDALKGGDIRISMDGRARWMDNVLIERLWRSLKYECVYLDAFETGSEARTAIGRWVAYYNADRPRSVFAGRTPDEVYAAECSASRPRDSSRNLVNCYPGKRGEIGGVIEP